MVAGSTSTEVGMRFPTSIRSAAAAPAQTADEYMDALREAAQSRIEEPVIAALGFAHQGMMSKKLVGHFGALPYLVARKHHEMRAGGLPQHFLLAITADRVYAIEHRVRANRDPVGEIGDEVARWDRS